MSPGGLVEVLGDALEQHEPLAVDGRKVSFTARPPDEAGLAHLLGRAGEHGAGVIPCGGRTQLELGNPPRRADLLLDTSGLAGLTELDVGEGVCQVRAGTRLGALRERLSDTGWELPLDAPDEASLGGTLATGAVGPRSAGFGLPRDVVLGLRVAHASGTLTQCGGRVVKNVTGYDLGKLYTGSLGTLGVLTSAWLRLRPAPRQVAVCELELSAAEAADAGLAIARRPAVRACVLASSGEVYRCVVELAGDEASVDEGREALAREHAAQASSTEVLEAARRRQSERADQGLRFRIGSPASRLGEVLAALARSEVAHLAYPGLGLVYALFEPDQREGAFAIALDAAAGCDLCCEAAPPESKSGHDVFGDVSASLPLLRALKQRFDPGGVLNPGRFAGGL